jgi:glycerol-3-phosphate dehydrogenase (NAD(P)+)
MIQQNDIPRIVSVVGAGSWGTAVARVIAENHPDVQVRIWAYEKSVVRSINAVHENRMYLPGISLPKNISATSRISDSVHDAGCIILATPSKAVYETCAKIRKYVNDGVYFGYLSKGFCKIGDDVLTIAETIARAVPGAGENIVALYGPSHAEEVVLRFHTCINVAGYSPEARGAFVKLLGNGYMSCRETDDIRGVELGGTLKNPAAIAAGMISVLPLCGDNLAGALISESIQEMLRVGRAMGARDETMIGISGMGDLVATALSEHSRNRRFGKDVARQILKTGRALGMIDRLLLRINPDRVLGRMSERMNYLAEGAYAIKPLIEIAAAKKIPVPVYRSLYEVLLNRKDPSLLIETIKDPDRFSNLYAMAKVHLSDRNVGLEKAKGVYFRNYVLDGLSDGLKKDGAFRKSIFEYRERLIGGGSDLQAGTGLNAGRVPRSSAIYAAMDYDRQESAVNELGRLYFDGMADRFSYTAYLIARALLKGLALFLKGMPGGNAFMNKNAETDSVTAIKASYASAGNLLYIAGSAHAVDFPAVLMTIGASGLPVPRFFVNAGMVKGSLERLALSLMGGYVVHPEMFEDPVYSETLYRYVESCLVHGIPVLFFSGRGTEENRNIVEPRLIAMLGRALLESSTDIAVIPVSVERSAMSNAGSAGRGFLYRLFDGDCRVVISAPILASDFSRGAVDMAEIGKRVENAWGLRE